MKGIIFAAAAISLAGTGPAAAQFDASLTNLRETKIAAVPAPQPIVGLIGLRAAALADNPDGFIDDPAEITRVLGLEPDEDKYYISKQQADRAKVRILVNLSAQRLTVASPTLNDTFVISSGKQGHGTPGSGKCFSPDFLDAKHRSSRYNNAPMPNSVFFNGNIAIHATFDTANLGRPASHGCVRVGLETSKKIFALVKAAGRADTSICVTGAPPANNQFPKTAESGDGQAAAAGTAVTE